MLGFEKDNRMIQKNDSKPVEENDREESETLMHISVSRVPSAFERLLPGVAIFALSYYVLDRPIGPALLSRVVFMVAFTSAGRNVGQNFDAASGCDRIIQLREKTLTYVFSQARNPLPHHSLSRSSEEE